VLSTKNIVSTGKTFYGRLLMFKS